MTLSMPPNVFAWSHHSMKKLDILPPGWEPSRKMGKRYNLGGWAGQRHCWLLLS